MEREISKLTQLEEEVFLHFRRLIQTRDIIYGGIQNFEIVARWILLFSPKTSSQMKEVQEMREENSQSRRIFSP